MANIFDKQTFLRIQLYYTADVASDIASVKIKYKNPAGTSGEWVATHDAVNKYVYYDIPKDSPLDVAGRWNFWIYATMNDERILIGDVATVYIEEEGTDKN